MSLAADLYLDQVRIEQQDEIAVDIHASAACDGYNRVTKASNENLYLMGYLEGMLRRCEELQQENELLHKQIQQLLKVEESTEYMPF